MAIRTKVLLTTLAGVILIAVGFFVWGVTTGRLGIWGSQLAPRFNISGIVLDSNQNAIPSALVELLEIEISKDKSGNIIEKKAIFRGRTTSQSNGKYEFFSVVGNKCYVAKATHPSDRSLFGYSKAISLTSPVTDADIILNLRLGIVKGKVYDVDSPGATPVQKKGIASAEIKFVHQPTKRTFVFKSIGAPDPGYYNTGVKEYIDTGSYTVTVTHPDYETGVFNVTVKETIDPNNSSQITTADFGLKKKVTTGSISGYVKDNAGTPVKGVRVEAKLETVSLPFPLKGSDDTDDNGYYSISGLSLGSYHLEAIVSCPANKIRVTLTQQKPNAENQNITLTCEATPSPSPSPTLSPSPPPIY